MNKNMQKVITHGLIQVIASAILVFLIGWLTVLWAEQKKLQKEEKSTVMVDNGLIILSAHDARIEGEGPAILEYFCDEGNIGYWHKKAQSLTWNIAAERNEKCHVEIDYSLPKGSETTFKIVVADTELLATVHGDGDWATWQSSHLGELTLPEGKHDLQLIPVELTPDVGVMNFVKLTFSPITQ